MAKVTPMDLVKSMSGKICGHSDISFAKRGDTQYTMKRCNQRTTPFTEEELAEDVAAFKAQKKYKSFRSYIWALEWADYTA